MLPRVTSMVVSALIFTLLCAVPVFSVEIPLKKKGGVFLLPVRINDVLTLDFILDSGASEVCIPADVVLTLLRTGTITGEDFLPGQSYRLADGTILKSPRFNIRQLEIGEQKLRNIPGVIAPVEGSLLLGQSLLEKIDIWSLDNRRGVLIIGAQRGSSPSKTDENTVQRSSEMPSTSNGSVWRDPVTKIEFIWLPGGCYEMGCGDWTDQCNKDEMPVHKTCLNGFWMGKIEVTQGQWAKVMGENPSGFQKGEDYPVEMVSWQDVQEFIGRLNRISGSINEFRLPTEAEWEYACRGGGLNQKYSGGNLIDEVSWYEKNSEASTHEALSKEPNGVGLFNMSGNVREWCEDIYSPDAYGKHQTKNPINMKGGSERVVRGGGWYTSQKTSRCSNRYSYPVTNRRSDLGFRLVRSGR